MDGNDVNSNDCDINSAGENSSNALQIQEQLQQEDEPVSVDDDQRVYLVPFRWLKEAQDSSSSEVKRGIFYAVSSTTPCGGAMKIFNSIFNSDIAFNLRKDDDSSLNNGTNGEVGITGRDYALVRSEMWLSVLKWHSNSKNATKDSKGFLAAEDMSDVYPLQLRLSVLRETNSLAVKISKKDNSVECFRRACKIFNVDSDSLRLWDFSGQTRLFFLNDENKFLKESQKQPEQDLLLELQVYGLSDSARNRGAKRDGMMQHTNGTSHLMNGNTINGSFSLVRSNSSVLFGSSCEAGTLGLTGLQNLGNTCFMNSALQCLVHTPKIVDYFLGDYKREINPDNPLGMNGEIASAFGDLLKKLWAPGATPVAPRTFKLKLAHFAPQFSGFNQHDSQELLAFLLDGLHEDLNRVRCKPYVEAKDSDGRPDEEVADEYWRNHLARNDSIIVDVCQGQYRSTLVCPDCRNVSVTFDPFMYLSLPLPSTSTRTMTLTVVKTDGGTQPSPFTVNVPKNGKLQDLHQALSKACSLGVDEALLLAEIYNSRIIRFLEEPTDSLSLIRDNDQLVAYRLPKHIEEAPLVVFMHQQIEELHTYGKSTPSWRAFGIPLVARKNIVNGSDIRETYLKLLTPFLTCNEDSTANRYSTENTTTDSTENRDSTENAATDSTENCDSSENTATEVMIKKENSTSPSWSPEKVEAKELYTQSDTELQFYLTDEKGIVRGSKIAIEEPVKSTPMPDRLNVLVCWSGKMVQQYNVQPLSLLPEVFKSGFFTKRPQDSVSLYKCFEAFLKEEPLGPEDMWYCPVCKKHCQASKKLDLWRLPKILVIHLKRFSYNRFLKNKLEAFVDFPIRDLDMSSYIAWKNGQSSHRYLLYAISNHYGSMGGGHYTAFVHHGGNQWYDFDDSHVSLISEDKIKTSAAYVLFYRRVEDI
ncbi:ubiquitin carboxyl-terminal hydrolase 8-like [Olea europaea var. sylvestris]|uniref:ubiquitin carboxyl-terminal hydrolase 8-like n=1 Tax=Olea europaea var. sylvestris TaxID=158386 RepID=UPI000C1D6313|nr:ubiquitin carboxyl-terminal hydrolase 8-like [Olea europaea var. sylvestris]